MRYRRDVVYSARAIQRDLCRGKLAWTFWDIYHLADYHGGAFLVDPSVSMKRGAYYQDGNIHVSPHLELEELLDAVTHELVHRFATEPRWTWLNSRIDSWGYDRRQFHEDVASIVGRMFVKEASRAEKRRIALLAQAELRVAIHAESVLDALAAELSARLDQNFSTGDVRKMLQAPQQG